MKQILIIMMFLSLAVIVNASETVFTLDNDNEVYVLFDRDYEQITVETPVAGMLRIDVPDDVLTVSIISMEDSLLSIYPNKGKKARESVYMTMGDIYSEYSMPDSAIKYYDLEFADFDNIDAYQLLIESIASIKPDSLENVMTEYSAKYPKRLSVVFVNALRYSKMELEDKFIELLKTGTSKKEKSEGFFYLSLYRMFYDDGLSDAEKADFIEFAAANFTDNSDLYYFIDEAAQIRDEKNAKKLDKAVKTLMGKNIDSNAKLSCAVYCIDNGIEYKNALKLLYEIKDDAAFDAEGYDGYIMYFIAKAEFRSGNSDKALDALKTADDIFPYKDRDYFELSMEIHGSFNDTVSLLTDAGNMLTLSTDPEAVYAGISTYIRMNDGIKNTVMSLRDSILNNEMLEYSEMEFDYSDIMGNNVTIPGNGIVFIDFFATWCGPCGMTIPHVVNLSSRYDDVSFFAVTREDDKDAILEYMQEKGMDFTVIMQGDDVMNAFKVRGIPSLFIINTTAAKMFNIVGYTEGVEDVLSIRIDYLKNMK